VPVWGPTPNVSAPDARRLHTCREVACGWRRAGDAARRAESSTSTGRRSKRRSAAGWGVRTAVLARVGGPSVLTGAATGARSTVRSLGGQLVCSDRVEAGGDGFSVQFIAPDCRGHFAGLDHAGVAVGEFAQDRACPDLCVTVLIGVSLRTRKSFVPLDTLGASTSATPIRQRSRTTTGKADR
jgi:hypothetical protein